MRDRFDLAIIGGGIHGAGVAFLASARGYDVLLVEKGELAGGTSSRSSKLIHGGLRYLETGQFSLVRESLAERAWHLEHASSLVRLRPFVIPVYRGQRRGPLTIRAGLTLYSLLAGLASESRFRSFSPKEWQNEAGLASDGLRRVFQYADAQTDDAALTRAVAARAEEWGADIRTQTKFVAGTRHEKHGWELTLRANGVKDGATGDGEDRAHEINVSARAVVNAAGPWVNVVAERIDPAPKTRPIELVQGAHIVVPGSLGESIYYLEAPSDGRAVFAMPWGTDTLVGTTETIHTGPPGSAATTPEEEQYLLAVFSHYFPGAANGGSPRVKRSFAGLRVLPVSKDSPFRRSRETGIDLHAAGGAPLLAIYGGKLTTWRATASRVLDRLIEAGALAPRTPTQAAPSVD